MSSSIIFYLNKDASKTSSDRLCISIQNTEAIVKFHADFSPEKAGVTTRMPVEEVVPYMSDLLDLLALDIDPDKMKTIDILNPTLPVVCLAIEGLNKDLVIRVVKRFMEYPSVKA